MLRFGVFQRYFGGFRMTVDEMIRMKSVLGYTNEMIAEKSGVPAATVQKIFSGTTRHPRYDTMKALEKVFVSYAGKSAESPGIIREAYAAYGTDKKYGGYTINDYRALPDDQRVELIDGDFFVMESPSHIHQLLVTSISTALFNYVSANHGNCLPIVSPMDVQLDRDDKTMLQPDILVVCDRSKFNDRCVYGAPDMVIEIMSPGTRKKDMSLKLAKYCQAGVREYWLVDPGKKQVIVYCFTEDDFDLSIYTFEDQVPVGIWDGACSVDFAKIYDYIKFLF